MEIEKNNIASERKYQVLFHSSGLCVCLCMCLCLSLSLCVYNWIHSSFGFERGKDVSQLGKGIKRCNGHKETKEG